ncbi:MAG: GNAT family N-acetyltransferase [Shimia sp.]|uniref:GNAT family N-acetyltransferase n=1 Tax=Shimia sp. TaxID=1954381 RepID=UPI00405840D5
MTQTPAYPNEASASDPAAALAARLAAVVPSLETERLILRAPVASDAEHMATFFASDRSKFVGGPLSAEQSWRVLATEIGHWTLRGYGRWIVETRDTQTPVGNVGLWYPHGWPEAEIGWDLFDGFEGQGFAAEAAIAARSYAYDVLGWQTVISLVDPQNTASRKLAQRLCARQDGVFQHERYGELQIWRHMSPSDIADGGMEAYA